DYDNDGKIDLLLADNETQGGMSLYHALGNGQFENVTKAAGLDRYSEAISCTAGDYDNDGFTDLAIITDGRVVLLYNEKDGTFKDVTKQAGIVEKKPDSKSGSNVQLPNTPIVGRAEPVGLTFIDYDHDGDLDLYITTIIPVTVPETLKNVWSEQMPQAGGNRMWRNNGNGTFTLATDMGLAGNTGSIAAVGTDYNNDRAVCVILFGGPWGE